MKVSAGVPQTQSIRIFLFTKAHSITVARLGRRSIPILRIFLVLPSLERDFSLFQDAQIGPGTHSASYSMGTGGLFSYRKAQGRGADHPFSFTAEVRNGWSNTFTPPVCTGTFLRTCLLGS